MQRKPATQRTSTGSAAGLAELLVQRIQHPEFPANCRRVNEPIGGTDDVFDNAAANFLEVLGGCQLLGVKPDADIATVQGFNLGERNKPNIRRQLGIQLTLGNIWVRNGAVSYGLVSLHFSDLARAVSFVRRNPDLAQTLMLASRNEVIVLFTLDGPKLPSMDLAGLRIQSGGELLLFDRSPGATPRYFIQYKRPVTTELRKINWDPDHESALLPHLVEASHGSFSRVTSRGKRVANCKAWTAYIVKVTQLLFSRIDGYFYIAAGDVGQWKPIERTQLETVIEGLIKESSLPDADKAVALEPVHMSKVVGRLKRLVAGESPVFDQVIRGFIDEMLEPIEQGRAGGSNGSYNFTVRELHQLCQDYAIERGKPVVPLTIFQRRIARLMAGPPLYLPKSQSVTRNGKGQNGFRGVRLRKAVPNT